jgi:hypothetical protein
MTFLVWPFVDADSTWKTSLVSRETNSSGPFLFHRNSAWGEITELYDWPSEDIFKESQFRLSSNFNSRKALGLTLAKRFSSFPKTATKRPEFFDKGTPSIKASKLRKILACKPPSWKNHEYVESGKFRTQRRWDPKTHKYVSLEVPIMVRKIKLIPGRKIGDLKTNALWFEEHQRSCSTASVLVRRWSDHLAVPPPFPHYVDFEQYFGPWIDIPLTGSGSLSSAMSSMASEFRDACLVDQPLITYSTEIAALDDKVVKKLYSKILNQKVDLATAMAEGAKSVRMIADLLMRLIEFFLGLYRLNPKRILSGFKGLLKDLLPSSPKKLANDFLAYRYGISPLMSDISGSVQSIADYLDSEPKVYARSRSSTLIDNSSFELEPTSLGFRRRRLEDKVSIDIAYKVTYAITDMGNRRLTELGFTNPVNVEWELVPFSFVVDWFLPIGNYLRGLTTFDHLVVKECHRTTTIRVNRFYFYDHPGTGGELADDQILQGSWVWSTADVYCYREIIPVPVLPLPTFKNPLSIGHLANAIALFVQLFKK